MWPRLIRNEAPTGTPAHHDLFPHKHEKDKPVGLGQAFRVPRPSGSSMHVSINMQLGCKKDGFIISHSSLFTFTTLRARLVHIPNALSSIP